MAFAVELVKATLRDAVFGFVSEPLAVCFFAARCTEPGLISNVLLGELFRGVAFAADRVAVLDFAVGVFAAAGFGAANFATAIFAGFASVVGFSAAMELIARAVRFLGAGLPCAAFVAIEESLIGVFGTDFLEVVLCNPRDFGVEDTVDAAAVFVLECDVGT